jgi:hypothetical protein
VYSGGYAFIQCDEQILQVIGFQILSRRNIKSSYLYGNVFQIGGLAFARIGDDIVELVRN